MIPSKTVSTATQRRVEHVQLTISDINNHTTSIDKLIHKVNSSTANLTCTVTNGIAYQFVCINSYEGWICTMSENTATLLDEPSVLVTFILKLCNVWQYFSASSVL